jgi:hypothetical protein
MGFDAYVQITLYFKNGRPYFYLNGEQEFDLTKIPSIPEEFRDFEQLRGYGYMALLTSTKDTNSYRDDKREITEIPIDEIVPDYDTMTASSCYEEGDITHTEFVEFQRFCDWVRKTGVDFTYYMSY